MYPRQTAYPTQPLGTDSTQQYPQVAAAQPPVTMMPVQAMQYNEEGKYSNSLVDIVTFGINITLYNKFDFGCYLYA